MKAFKEFLDPKCIDEVSPPGKKAEDWIKSNKAEFKKEYGDGWDG